jgi:hypothetical protein
LHLLYHPVGNPRDGVFGDLGVIDVSEMRRDVAGGQPAGIQRQNDLIDAGQPALPLGHVTGSKLPSRSRGTSMVTSPESVTPFWGAFSCGNSPGSDRADRACHSPEAPPSPPPTRSPAGLGQCFQQPAWTGRHDPLGAACRTNSLAAASSPAEGGSAGSFDDGGLTRSLDPTGKGKARWATRWKPAIETLQRGLFVGEVTAGSDGSPVAAWRWRPPVWAEISSLASQRFWCEARRNEEKQIAEQAERAYPVFVAHWQPTKASSTRAPVC